MRANERKDVEWPSIYHLDSWLFYSKVETCWRPCHNGIRLSATDAFLPVSLTSPNYHLDISLREELVRLEVLDDEFLLFLGRAAFEHLVENVE